jgi:transcriptional regulator with XRE-family HTH domain
MATHQPSHASSDHDDTNFIGKNLLTLLKKHHLTANQLAQLLDIPFMTIRRLISGETEDPRVSTLKIIANYFQISVDLLINDSSNIAFPTNLKVKTYAVPKIKWENLPKISHIALSDITDLQSISLNGDHTISDEAFALESKPSMYPRFPRGTIFIIEPHTTPTDGDLVLVSIKDNNDCTMRELIIDPPVWYLTSLITDSHTMSFDKEQHSIVGVAILTLLYHPKFGQA